MELAYFNTNHPDFVGGNRAASSQASSSNNQQSSHPDNNNNNIMVGHRQSHNNNNNTQLLQEAAMMVTGNQQQQQPIRSTKPHSPLLTGSTATTTPEHLSTLQPPNDIQFSQPQPSGGFLGFFKSSRGNAPVPYSTTAGTAMQTPDMNGSMEVSILLNRFSFLNHWTPALLSHLLLMVPVRTFNNNRAQHSVQFRCLKLSPTMDCDCHKYQV